MKIFIFTFVFIFYQVLGQPQPTTKKHYEPPSLIEKTITGGIDTSDTDDPSTAEFQYLRNRDMFHIMKKVETTLKGIISKPKDLCLNNFSGHKYFTDRKIVVTDTPGNDVSKDVEIEYWDKEPSVLSGETVHQCSCKVDGSQDAGKSFCVNGFVFIAEGVGGDKSYFIFKKSDKNDNLNVNAKITLDQPKPEEKKEEKKEEKPQDKPVTNH